METQQQEQEEAAPAVARPRTVPDPFPWGAELEDDEDVEATRLVTGGAGGDRFVLQFSTGESVTVTGSGLIGRNPAAQPGEFVDQLVSIFDVGKSVSKTHLEFGQEGGRFWVSDRYSTNGSVVRQPEAEARRCEPGRRYFVVRGTRIDVGEQFFVVS
ncbi:MAG: FHA domain-containing protein [Schumannella sp.]